jgi:flagellar basal body-associated protein FliL
MGEYTPEPYETVEASSFEAPPQKKSNTGLIIAIVVILLLLCCCCVALLVFGWFYGDQILEALGQFGQAVPLLLTG